MRRVVAAGALAVTMLGIMVPLAQESPSFRLDEGAFNAGGHPRKGAALSSLSFTISLHSIGQGVISPGLSSSSFNLESGLVSAFTPPGEVQNVHFTSLTRLVWNPERSADDYPVYRGSISDPFDAAYGLCRLPIPEEATTSDSTTPEPGETFFYLVTARNRLDEEGTKGAGSDHRHLALAVGQDGHPVLSYHRRSSAPGDLAFWHRQRSGPASLGYLDLPAKSLQPVNPDDGQAAAEDKRVAMAIGTDGMPIIVYYDGTNEQLKVTHCANRYCLSYVRE